MTLLGAAIGHFFPHFNAQLARIRDPRRQDRVTYPIGYMIWGLLLSLMSGGGSTRQWAADTDEEGFVRTLQAISGIAGRAAAHPDTGLYLLSKLVPMELIGFQAELVRRLLRMRCLERFRFGIEWLVAVDGVWLRTYDHPHCPHCLHQTKDGHTTWFHAVLEAKLILANGMAISLCSVPIENPAGAYDKQDCETKAFFRLAALLADLFPRLPICLLGDSLYACAPVLEECRKRHWSFIFVFKPGRTPQWWAEAERCWQRSQVLDHQRPDGVRQQFRWATNLTFDDHVLHAIHCHETATDGKESTWAWITDHRPNRKTVSVIANQGGRRRDQIEQTFNVQKNGEFELRHDYGSHQRAWYNLYLLVQVAHLLRQLMSHTDLVNRLSAKPGESFRDTFRTIANFVRRMFVSIQTELLDPFWCSPRAGPIHVHFLSA